MAILDIFKKKEEGEKKEVKKEVKKLPKVKIAKKAKVKKVKAEEKKIPEAPAAPRQKGKPTGLAYRVLKGPHITEKATDLAAKNQYIFKVQPTANKTEVKRIVQEVYGIDVLDVKMINVPQKKRKFGKSSGFRQGYRKAIVRIKEGQKIEVMPR